MRRTDGFHTYSHVFTVDLASTITHSHHHTLTDEEVEGDVVCGKCEVRCVEMVDTQDRDSWFSQSPDRFYFFEVSICHHIIHVYSSSCRRW